MIYHVVSHHRTGSTLLNNFSVASNDGFGFNEFFIEQSRHLSNYTIEEKFEFLEFYKQKDIHFPLKVIPDRIVRLGLGDRLFHYLQGYNILTIHRDAFDCFLSKEYQRQTHWVNTHRFKDNYVDMPNITFTVDYDSIKDFKLHWNNVYNFIDRLDIHTKFCYEDLTINNLQKFFNTDYVPITEPMNIDYQSMIINLDEVKEVFYNEMYCS